MLDYYAALGVPKIVNAAGAITRYGGSLMHPQVLQAMQAAAEHFVDLDVLQAKAGPMIAAITGAESGIVTAGAAGALLAAAAACMTGTSLARIASLPNTGGFPNKIAVHRAHRNGYDQSVRASGAQLVEFGYAHRTTVADMVAAIDESTVGILYVLSPWTAPGALPIESVVEIAHGHSIPVIADAAATLPPFSNLRRFVALGADLVCFSGGKGLKGPQAGGILCGRRELIAAATLNMSPNYSVGRASKTSKEDIVGTIAALDASLALNEEAEYGRWQSQANTILEHVLKIGGAAELTFEPIRNIAVVEIDVASSANRKRVHHELRSGNPAVYLSDLNGSDHVLVASPHMLRPGEEHLVGSRLAEVVSTLIATNQL